MTNTTEGRPIDYLRGIADSARSAVYLAKEHRADEAGKHIAAIERLIKGYRAVVADEPSAPAYRSSSLPSRDTLCSCGHTGLDHHHSGTKCWANLPRTRQPNGTLSAVLICDCAQFAESSS